MAYNDGKICDWYEIGVSTCFLNGSKCHCPFSKKGCEIQCETVFKCKPEGEGANRYCSDSGLNDKFKTLTKQEIYKRLDIKKGDRIADYFIPYSQFDILQVGSNIIINEGISEVKNKFTEIGWDSPDYIRIYHNVEMLGTIGVYIIGIIRSEDYDYTE